MEICVALVVKIRGFFDGAEVPAVRLFVVDGARQTKYPGKIFYFQSLEETVCNKDCRQIFHPSAYAKSSCLGGILMNC